MSRPMSRWVARGLLSLTCVGLLGCGAQAFEPQFRERAEPEITLALRALAEVESPAPGAPLVVLTTATGLRAVSLEDGVERWAVEADVQTSPILAGEHVVATEGGTIVGRRLSDGERVFDAGAGRLLGAESDGERVVISIAEGPETSPRGRLVLADAGGARWSHELQMPIGVAAVAEDLVIVPWATQRVSFLQAEDGVERARLRFSDRVVGRAWTAGGRTMIGQHDVVLVGPELEDEREIVGWQPQARPLPGQPPFLADGYTPVAAPDGAANRVRLVWTPVPGEPVTARDGVLYFLFYRQVFALESDRDEARWVRVLPRDVVGAEPVEGGLWIVDAQGRGSLLAAADGRVLREVELGGATVAAALRAPPASGEPTEEARPPLVEQLLEAARLDDNRLGGGRGLAARLLGGFSEAEVTGHLVELCANRASPEPARQAACEALATRTTGPAHVRAALSHHGSFLAGRSSPPVGPLARAAASMSLRAVVPLLLRHLADPSTPNAELPVMLTALADMGATEAAPEIDRFVRLYHASADAQLAQAVVAGALALRRLDARRGDALLAHLAGDPFTPDALEGAIARAVAADEATASQAAAAAEREAQRAERRARTVDRQAARAPARSDDRPERIDAGITERVFDGSDRALRRCLEGEAASLRISMVVDGDGEIGTVAVSPSESQGCVEPIVRRLRFPETRLGLREQVVHRVRR